jgi:hypothetical protein
MSFPLSRSVAALAGFVFTGPLQDRAPTSTPPVPPEAYPVYNAVLTHYVEGDKQAIVSIVRFTNLESTDCLDHIERSRRWKSAVADLRSQNASPQTIERRFDLPFRYELADSLETVGGARLPPPGKSFAEFIAEQIARLEDMDKRHYVQVQLSAPGISQDGQLAIVYLAISFAGGFRILRRSGSKWVVQRQECGWMS